MTAPGVIGGYPPTSREAVSTYLLQLLQPLSAAASPAGPFVTITRKLKLWGDVPAEEQPWLCFTEHSEEYSGEIKLPPKRGWHILFWIYATVPNDNVTPGAAILNPLIDALETVIVPLPKSSGLSLGNQIYSATPRGPVHKECGDLDGQAIAIVPFLIRAP